MFDTGQALADMAQQIRSCRSEDGLTLQQLARRSGVAASTIHKIEARQMVPTISVLLKIAKGLGRRPDELVRDRLPSADALDSTPESSIWGATEALSLGTEDEVGVWRIRLDVRQYFPALRLSPLQRAIVLAEEGVIELRAGAQRVRLDAGRAFEVEGGRIESSRAVDEPTRLTLIVSPRGALESRLGAPVEPRPLALRSNARGAEQVASAQIGQRGR